MRWIEVAVPTGSDKIDETCDELLALGGTFADLVQRQRLDV
jgi:hypothetical protein